jgi:hypothetical protein
MPHCNVWQDRAGVSKTLNKTWDTILIHSPSGALSVNTTWGQSRGPHSTLQFHHSDFIRKSKIIIFILNVIISQGSYATFKPHCRNAIKKKNPVWNFNGKFLRKKLVKNIYLLMYGSRDSAVGIATGYGLDDWEIGVRVPVGSRIITSPCLPDRLWGPPNLLYNRYWGLFPGGKAAGAWSWPLTSGWCRGQENVDVYIHSSIRLHGVVLN